ncbi:MAG: HU family DNA-binding protein [Bryobacteraceae bacterium]
MRKNELSERLAREVHLSKAKAADRVDRVVHDLMKRLRKGEAVSLPGLGKLSTGKTGPAVRTPDKGSRTAGKGGVK